MAEKKATDMHLESLTPKQQEIASRILGRLPQAQRLEAVRMMLRLVEKTGAQATDGLLHIDAIISSGKFKPSYLGTIGLIVDRSGENASISLMHFSRIVESEKFNPHVHETARLAVIRTGADSNEALLALNFMLSNPNFTPSSLNIALPDRFLRFLDVAMRSGRDDSYMAIRILGSLFCNPNFTPSDVNDRSAATFGTLLRTVRETAGADHRIALEALSTVLANSSVRPQDLDAAKARNLVLIVNQDLDSLRSYITSSTVATLNQVRVIHNRSPSAWNASEVDPRLMPSLGPQISIEGTSHILNLILGDRCFSLDMIAPEKGVLTRFIANSKQGEIPSALVHLRDFLRHARSNPEAIALATRLIGNEECFPSEAVLVVDAILSNASLAPLLPRPDFQERLSLMLKALSSGTYELDIKTVVALLRDGNLSPALFERTGRMTESLGRKSDHGLFFLRSFMQRPGFLPQMVDERFFTNLEAFIKQLAVLPLEGQTYTFLGDIFKLPNFSARLIEPGNGIILEMLRACRRSNTASALEAVGNILRYRRIDGPLEDILRQLVAASHPVVTSSEARHSATVKPGADIKIALSRLSYLISRPDFSDACLPGIQEAILESPDRAGSLLSLYGSLMGNPNFRTLITSKDFIRRMGALAGNIAHGQASPDQLATLIADPSFTPKMLRSMEDLFQMAGPGSNAVLRSIVGTRGRVPLATMLSSSMTQFLAAMVLETPQASRDAVGDALGDALNKIGMFLSLDGMNLELGADERQRVLKSYREFLKGAGTRAGLAAPSFIPLLYVMFSKQGVFPTLEYTSLTPEKARTFGEWARGYIDGLPPALHPQAVAGLGSMFGSMTYSQALFGLLSDEPELFRRGQMLARKLIGGFAPPEICFNFAYAIQTIGEEKTALLYRRFGIRYFARYSEKMLERLCERASGRSTRPPILAVFPQNDWNGAFYQAARELDSLLGEYDVVVYECDGEEKFYGAAKDFSRSFGRTSTLIIAGHGQTNQIQLGEDNEQGTLDLTDADELAVVRQALGPNPTVILNSCSTGKNAGSIGALISRVLSARLFAPDAPGQLSDYHIDSEGKVSATYSKARTSVFAAGKLSPPSS